MFSRRLLSRILTRIILLLFLSCSNDCSALEISVPDAEIEASEGKTLILNCTVTGDGIKEFNFFFNQIIWYKIVPELVGGEGGVGRGSGGAGGGEGGVRELQINTGAIINEPFNATQRYSIEPRATTTEIAMPLVITDVRLIDNGTYRCSLKQKQNILASVHYQLIVPVQVKNLTLHSTRLHRHGNGRRITYEFNDSVPTRVSCRGSGGNPAPRLRIYLGEEEVTGDFQETVEMVRVGGGAKGLVMMSRDVTLTNDAFIARAVHHEKHLRCIASVEGYDGLTKRVDGIVDVKFAPRFVCDKARVAALHTRDFKLDCLIRANPPVRVDDVTWLIDDANGTRLTPGTNNEQFTAQATELDSSLEVILTISEVNPSSYGLYSLKATNSVGERDFQYELVEESHVVPFEPFSNERIGSDHSAAAITNMPRLLTFLLPVINFLIYILMTPCINRRLDYK